MTNINAEYTIPEMTPELQRGPAWLRDRRREARVSFNDTPLPKRGLHLWRYTDPSKFMFVPSGDAARINGHFQQVLETEKGHVADGHLAGLVHDNAGREISIHGLAAERDQGVIVSSLSDAVEHHFGLVEKHLYQLVNNRTGKFEALNGALWNDGIFIYVPDGRTVAKPLHLLRSAGGAGTAQYPRLLAVVGKNAELTLIDEYGGGSSDEHAGIACTNSAVEIFGCEDSRVRYVTVQRQGPASHNYLTYRARVERGARVLTIPLAFGAALSKHNFGVVLNGPGADSHMYGMLFASGYQHFDNHTLHHHASGQTYSNIDFKVVLRDKALSAYTGLIRIDRHAKTCEAYQENRNLLLSKGCKAETIPELEILNEDVSCSHGATIGPIDPLMTFYLNSRGIPDDAAVRMIVSGFVASTLREVPDDLRERVEAFVIARLEGL